MPENTEQKNSEYEHFSRSVLLVRLVTIFLLLLKVLIAFNNLQKFFPNFRKLAASIFFWEKQERAAFQKWTFAKLLKTRVVLPLLEKS